MPQNLNQPNIQNQPVCLKRGPFPGLPLAPCSCPPRARGPMEGGPAGEMSTTGSKSKSFIQVPVGMVQPSGRRCSATAAVVRRQHMSSPSSCFHSCHLLLIPPLPFPSWQNTPICWAPRCTEDTKQIPTPMTSLIIPTRTNQVYWRTFLQD